MPLKTEVVSAPVSEKSPTPIDPQINVAESKTEPAPVQQETITTDAAFEKKIEDKQDAQQPKQEDKHPDDPKKQTSTRVAAMIARKEKEIRRKQDELKAEYDRIKKIEDQAKTLLDAVKKAKDDPAALAEAAGIPIGEYYSKLTRKIIDPEKVSQEDKIEKAAREVQEMRNEIKAREDREYADKIENGKRGYISHVMNVAAQSDGKYEMIGVFGEDGASEVLDLQVRHFNKTGKSLTDDEAMSKIEDGLRENVKEELSRLAKTKFFEEFVKSIAGDKHEGQQTTAQATKAALKTLTNQTLATPPVREIRNKSRDEQFEDLISSRMPL